MALTILVFFEPKIIILDKIVKLRRIQIATPLFWLDLNCQSQGIPTCYQSPVTYVKAGEWPMLVCCLRGQLDTHLWCWMWLQFRRSKFTKLNYKMEANMQICFPTKSNQLIKWTGSNYSAMLILHMCGHILTDPTAFLEKTYSNQPLIRWFTLVFLWVAYPDILTLT